MRVCSATSPIVIFFASRDCRNFSPSVNDIFSILPTRVIHKGISLELKYSPQQRAMSIDSLILEVFRSGTVEQVEHVPLSLWQKTVMLLMIFVISDACILALAVSYITIRMVNQLARNNK